MRRMTRLAALLAIMALIFTACGGDGDPSRPSNNETKDTNRSIDRLITSDPAHTMDYSPTRKTINHWIDTWGVKGQLAFVYLLNEAGEQTGYFVFDGPPVSMCASLTKTWTYENRDGGDAGMDLMVPRRSIDGVYYSGGQCNAYYGRDASTGAYVEFTVGGAQNYVLTTQPLPIDVPAKGFTKTSDVQCDPAGNGPDCVVK